MADLRKALPELSLDTQTLERLMETIEIGIVVSYRTLSAAIGRDVTREARGNLRSARERLRRERHIVFGAVVNEGLKRLDDIGKVSASQSHVTRSRNQARFAQLTIKAVDDFNALPDPLKVTHNVILATAGALYHMTSARTAKRLETAIAGDRQTFSPRQCMELMAPSVK